MFEPSQSRVCHTDHYVAMLLCSLLVQLSTCQPFSLDSNTVVILIDTLIESTLFSWPLRQDFKTSQSTIILPSCWGIAVSCQQVRLTHLRLASLLWDIGKQHSPRCDAAERGVPSGAILFAKRIFIKNLFKN